MVSSVAVLSDIHGVMPALDAVLAELARGEVGDVGDAIAPWAAKQLSPDHVDWLRACRTR